MAHQVDAIGELLTPGEKEILRSRDQGDRPARDTLVAKLADIFTFRRVPRGRRDREIPFDCIRRAGLPELIDTPSACQFPALSPNDLLKAEAVMQHVVRRIVPTNAPDASSRVTADELKGILQTAQNKWTRDGRDRCLGRIIDNIPNRSQIKKVVCIGLSEIAARMAPGSNEITIFSRNLAQHLAVVSMVDYLSSLVSHNVELFAADWSYDDSHKTALKSIGFTVLGAFSGKQEHFVEIDDDTMVITFAIADFESILPIISEYARPVAFIHDAYDYILNGTHTRPKPSPVWSKVKYHNVWVTVPGPPMDTAVMSQGYCVSETIDSMFSGLPFYTESTGRMLDEYRVAMRMSELDVSGLANPFKLHSCTGNRPSDLDETAEKRFMGERSCLFVRK